MLERELKCARSMTQEHNSHGESGFDVIWTGCHLATMTGASGDYGIVRDGAIASRNGLIAWVGRQDQLDAATLASATKTVNLGGAWLTPGLIDCHTHIVFAGNRVGEFEERQNGKSYAEIARAGGGINATVRATRAASESDLVAASRSRLEALLSSGVTTVEIKSGYGLRLDTELRMLRAAHALAGDLGFGLAPTYLGAHTLPPEFAGRSDEYIERICNTDLREIAASGLATAVDAYCEDIAFSPEQTARVFVAAREHGLDVKLHADQLSDTGGAELAARYTALSADHLEYSDRDGIEAMARSGTVAVLLPGAFYMLREIRQPPVAMLRQYQIPIAIATDCNPGTSPMCSILDAINMGCTLFGLTPAEALHGVTSNAARALGMSEDRGTLETSKRADFAIWDIAEPAELSYWIGRSPLRQRIVGGIDMAD